MGHKLKDVGQDPLDRIKAPQGLMHPKFDHESALVVLRRQLHHLQVANESMERLSAELARSERRERDLAKECATLRRQLREAKRTPSLVDA